MILINIILGDVGVLHWHSVMTAMEIIWYVASFVLCRIYIYTFCSG